MRRDDVHLVGSIPLSSAEEVFTKLCDSLGDHLCRLPDGETGERARWVYWQRTMLENHPDMEVDTEGKSLKLHEWDGTLLREMDLMRFKPGVSPADVNYDTGYDTVNIASWRIFSDLQDNGKIPGHLRYQVALPTPISSAFMYVSPAAYEDYFPTYERSLLRALDNIVAAIPADKLSIQYDICQEVLVFENYFPTRPADYKERIFALMGRLGDAVPDGVELGYHLCYGTPRDKHLVMPKDGAILAELSNAILDRVGRNVDFLHLPVPQDRDDETYFAPLGDIKLGAATKLYLGLIHYQDASGDQARMRAAAKVCRNFGIATECGWGRADPERLDGLLEAHTAAVKVLSA
ncbi:MAG: hypothetical protein OSB82_03640 [Alphaproteobacteria bacterium]|nr:hypothetical protein [Alphaproteobacteria bacterium]